MIKKINIHTLRRACCDDVAIGNVVIYQNKKHVITALDYGDIMQGIVVHLKEIKKRM